MDLMKLCTSLKNHPDQTLYWLCVMMVVAVTLVVRHRRSQSFLSDPENHSSDTESQQHKPSFDTVLNVQEQTQDVEFLRSLLAIRSGQPDVVTSGFLAAKADIENATNSAELVEEPSNVDETQNKEALGHSLIPQGFFDNDPVSWKRHTYPGAPSLKNTLQGDCRHDQVEFLVDDNDPAFMWRRRTMTFGTAP